jgi:hypothetical protein
MPPVATLVWANAPAAQKVSATRADRVMRQGEQNFNILHLPFGMIFNDYFSTVTCRRF